MSFDQLMQHAADILEKAAVAARRERTAPTTGRGSGGGPTLDEMRQKYAYVVPAFEPFAAMPDPAKYDLYINELKMAMELLNPSPTLPPRFTGDVKPSNVDMSAMVGDSLKLEGWTGQAARNFEDNFVVPFPMYVGNQITALWSMRGALEAHQAMWAAARADIDKIAEDTIHQLDNLGGSGKNALAFTFTVLSAVVTITTGIMTLVTGGATAPLVPIAAVAASGNVALSASNLGSPGTSVESIIGSMMQGIDTLRQNIQEVEQTQIANVMKSLTQAFEDNKGSFVAARPALADMSLSDIPGDMGLPPGLVNRSQL